MTNKDIRETIEHIIRIVQSREKIISHLTPDADNGMTDAVLGISMNEGEINTILIALKQITTEHDYYKEL